MNASWKVVLGVGAAAALLFGWFVPQWRAVPNSPSASAIVLAKPKEERRAVAAPGVVEAASEEVAVHAEISARLTRVAVEEGDRVTRGQTLATLDDTELRAREATAASLVNERQAAFEHVLVGANQLERREAWVGLKEAEASLEHARAQLGRRQKLFEAGVFSREEVEVAASDLRVAQERWEKAFVHRDLVNARAVPEERRKSEAAVETARAQLAEARALLAKTTLRAPLSGVVLRKYLRAGEMASPESKPVLTMADTARLRVRAEVDETDIAKVNPGQEAYVTAAAYGERRFAGRVVRIANVLGKKHVHTDEPAERVDTKVLETLVELEPGAGLPIGLRVTVFLLAKQ